ncbi:MAG: hypothetical protein HC840_32540 [Leptolyngbyaceae cyanobacterium RM2_2_4]|nr:hypothetical protein [Leptolyngbyaceae cyanobacterium RM2_2_4]
MLRSSLPAALKAMTSQSSTHSDDRIDILVDQVRRLTEGITEFRLSMERSSAEFRAALAEFRTDMAELKTTVQRQAATAEHLVQTTDRPVRIVETLIQRQQAEGIAN